MSFDSVTAVYPFKKSLAQAHSLYQIEVGIIRINQGKIIRGGWEVLLITSGYPFGLNVPLYISVGVAWMDARFVLAIGVPRLRGSVAFPTGFAGGNGVVGNERVGFVSCFVGVGCGSKLLTKKGAISIYCTLKE